ncbi:RNase P subunit p29-like protein [Exidia glandulosa HHB12029]|uniref:Ribonuclease P protein subunit n=1 Tax=Exidia glandulosa HHB12029 TaxID=1314781 RepID=A0A165N5Y8_EXIGL|nr:RNase P subunit p29-like protein [Exidia glandulosa HHB12029]
MSLDPYSELPPGTRVKFESAAPFTPVYVQHQLGKKGAEYYDNRVKGKFLNLDKSIKESRVVQLAKERLARREKDAQRRSARKLGASLPEVKGLWTLDQKDAQWSVFLSIHRLWLGYMVELLNLPARPAPSTTKHRMPHAADMQGKLVKADFHGCIITVRKAKNPFLVGRSGIVIHETENTFKVVTRKNRIKVLPKHNSIFVFCIPLYGPPPVDEHGIELKSDTPEPEIEFELYGNHFCYRSSDRANRKFKHKETIELL